MRRCRKIAAFGGWVSRVEDASVARACPASHETVSGRRLAKAVRLIAARARMANSRRWGAGWQWILVDPPGKTGCGAGFSARPGNTPPEARGPRREVNGPWRAGGADPDPRVLC